MAYARSNCLTVIYSIASRADPVNLNHIFRVVFNVPLLYYGKATIVFVYNDVNHVLHHFGVTVATHTAYAFTAYPNDVWVIHVPSTVCWRSMNSVIWVEALFEIVSVSFSVKIPIGSLVWV